MHYHINSLMKSIINYCFMSHCFNFYYIKVHFYDTAAFFTSFIYYLMILSSGFEAYIVNLGEN